MACSLFCLLGNLDGVLSRPHLKGNPDTPYDAPYVYFKQGLYNESYTTGLVNVTDWTVRCPLQVDPGCDAVPPVTQDFSKQFPHLYPSSSQTGQPFWHIRPLPGCTDCHHASMDRLEVRATHRQ